MPQKGQSANPASNSRLRPRQTQIRYEFSLGISNWDQCFCIENPYNNNPNLFCEKYFHIFLNYSWGGGSNSQLSQTLQSLRSCHHNNRIFSKQRFLNTAHTRLHFAVWSKNWVSISHNVFRYYEGEEPLAGIGIGIFFSFENCRLVHVLLLAIHTETKVAQVRIALKNHSWTEGQQPNVARPLQQTC